MHDLLVAQTKFLRKLRGLGEKTIKRIHREMFKPTKWEHETPRYVGRDVFERRLFCLWRMRQEPDDKTFCAYAERVLARPLRSNEIKQAIKLRFDAATFTQRRIEAMGSPEVDRWLAVSGLAAPHLDLAVRRRLLFQLHHRYRKQRRTGVREAVWSVMLDHPNLDFPTYRRQFHGAAPSLSPIHFRLLKHQLRRIEGSDVIPRLHPGRRLEQDP